MKAYRTISGVLLTDIWMIYKYKKQIFNYVQNSSDVYYCSLRCN